jgi:hypothetical protein
MHTSAIHTCCHLALLHAASDMYTSTHLGCAFTQHMVGGVPGGCLQVHAPHQHTILGPPVTLARLVTHL